VTTPVELVCFHAVPKWFSHGIWKLKNSWIKISRCQFHQRFSVAFTPADSKAQKDTDGMTELNAFGICVRKSYTKTLMKLTSGFYQTD